MIGNKGFLIFSVFSTKNDHLLNNINSNKNEDILQDLNIPFKRVKGCYKGILEFSYVISNKYENEVLQIAQDFNQESILQVDELGNSILRYIKNNSIEKIGKFIEVDKIIALKENSYTYDFTTCKYYIIK